MFAQVVSEVGSNDHEADENIEPQERPEAEDQNGLESSTLCDKCRGGLDHCIHYALVIWNDYKCGSW